MLEIINMLSTLDDLLVIAGVILIAYGQGIIGVICILLGVGIMFGKGEIGVPIR
jgi:hypothetical protein